MAAYCDRAFLEALAGSRNVYAWADKDNLKDDTAVAAAITEALDQATSDIDDRLRGGVYTVPFTGTIPRTIKDLCRKQAACILYASRGTEDTDDEGQPADRLKAWRMEVERKLRMIRAGQITLDADGTASYPFVVRECHRHTRDYVK